MTYPLLEKAEDFKNFEIEDLNSLASEVRKKILSVLSKNGGHLSSNLGIVELTIAIHRVFDSPIDKILFDTSHQCYTHKLLTGRYKKFDSLRKFKGISGFLDPKESAHDHFFSGHAGACFSSALGLSKNRDFLADDNFIIPILGDGSFTCGLTLEALNNIPKDLKKFVVILNDNKMAISNNVGNIKNILSRLINSPSSNKIYHEIIKKISKIPALGQTLAEQGQKITESIKNLVSQASFFEQFGLSYVGPIDGHDIPSLIEVLEGVKKIEGPVIVHVITQKGKGLKLATQNPTSYHGVKPFNIENGQFYPSTTTTTFPKIFGQTMTENAKKDKNLIAITPAMVAGSALLEFSKKFPKRLFDVGIAEGHAISFAGAMAYNKKLKIVACVYSTFLQRAFDNIFHDVALQQLPVTIAIDRAGISGPDGPTHHGIYDISFLNALPNMIIAQPRNGQVLKELLENSFSYNNPVSIRYPNLPTQPPSDEFKKREVKGEIIKKGEQVLLIPLGHMVDTAIEVSDLLLKEGINPTIVDPVFIKPIDQELFLQLLQNHQYVITIEEHALHGGFGSIFNSFIIQNNLKNNILNFGIKDSFVEHGKREDLLKMLGLDSKSISKKILKRVNSGKKVQI